MSDARMRGPMQELGIRQDPGRRLEDDMARVKGNG